MYLFIYPSGNHEYLKEVIRYTSKLGLNILAQDDSADCDLNKTSQFDRINGSTMDFLNKR